MRQLLLTGLACLLFGCSTQEVLEPLPATPDRAVDFSGDWELVSDATAERQIIDAAISEAMRRQGSGSRSRSSKSGGLVQVFLESGESLKITQTDDGMFFSFDRSVVEEYRFGENRLVSVGAIEAQRVSGWEGVQYVVVSLDKNGMKLTERIWLGEGNEYLHREFTFRDDKNREVVANQTYLRVTN